MEARHAFIKGRRGNGIFYRSEDFIVMITIVSVLVKEYNNEYGRKGAVFQKPFGSSLKIAIKVIMGCVAYVFNNPVAGKLSVSAKEYRWSLLAYHNNGNPFSEPLRKETCRHKMRVALQKVDYFHSRRMFLSYAALRDILDGLDPMEHGQIIDNILYKYSFISYESLEELYGTFGKAIVAIESNAGAEFELEDEYGDHSCYRRMLNIVMKYGYKGRRLNFESLPKEEIEWLFRLLRSKTPAPGSSVNKFLHSDI